MSENLVLERLPDECRLAAKCLEETDTFEIGQSLFREAAEEITRLRAALADAQAVGFAAGVEAAAKYIDRRVNNYIDEHGIFDWETGATEFPGNGEEWVADQEETAEAIRALTPPDLAAAAARVLLGDDIQIARMAAAVHDGPLGADDHWFSAATKQGAWCVDVVRAALRAIAGDTP